MQSTSYQRFRIDDFGTEAIDKMIETTKNPVLLARMAYSKHKGMKFEAIPIDYLKWLSGTDLDENLAYTVKHHLGIWSKIDNKIKSVADFLLTAREQQRIQYYN